MSSARWSERDTTPERIEAALRELLRERHAADETLVPARALNLVVVIDREWRGEIINRLERIGQFHPSRTIICTVEEGRRELDAQVIISDDHHTEGGIGVLRESAEIVVGTSHLARVDTIVDPLIVTELPTVLWSPHSRDDAVEALLGIIDVILIDTDDPVHFDGVGPALNRAEELVNLGVQVVDLAWLRTVPWRERLAGGFEDPARDGQLEALKRIYIRHNPGSIVSGLLLSGWLASRMGWEPTPLQNAAGGVRNAVARRENAASVNIEFEPVPQVVPGLAGITVTGSAGFSYSLERAAGGLIAREQRAGIKPRQWRLFGASRGESGILGEGVRQALMRDPTYEPALHAARSFNP